MLTFIDIAVLLLVASLIFFLGQRNSLKARKLGSIPTVGASNFYIGSWNFLKHAHTILEEGNTKHPNKAFKVPLFRGWMVIVTGPTMVEDIRKAPEELLSSRVVSNSFLNLEHTLGYNQYHDPYQASVLRKVLTRNIDFFFPCMRSEVISAFEDHILTTSDAWISLPITQAVMQIISRVFNRPFLGLKCRDAEYIETTIKFSDDILNKGQLLNLVPPFLRSIAMEHIGGRAATIRRALKVLGPILQYRLTMDDTYGREWPNSDRPNDLISWLLDRTDGHPLRRDISQLTATVLVLNMGTLHTTSQVFIQALFNLATHPECVSGLREEVESIVDSDGWTKLAVSKMLKIDSFLRDTAACSPFSDVLALRRVMQDFTFSDGTCIPAGTDIGTYTPPREFDPLHFFRMRSKDGESSKHQLVNPSEDFLVFGIGRQACPGRFLAANLLKLFLAHVVVTYDVKFKDGKRPATQWTTFMATVDPKGEIMFRARQ
ncbi:cytochrome P450 [Mycena filopes]|nr:cytochrome P450 [Mycena filopes]